jgi:hypothetical protein
MNLTRSLLLALGLTGLTLTACGDKDDDSGTGDETDGTTDGADGAADGADGASDGADGTSSAAPSIDEGRVVCVPPTSGPEAIVVEVQVGDPQGADTLASGTFKATNGGTVLFDDVALVCSPTGACTASIRSEDYGTSCADGPSVTWEVEMVDEDGNSSGWVSVAWEG